MKHVFFCDFDLFVNTWVLQNQSNSSSMTQGRGCYFYLWAEMNLIVVSSETCCSWMMKMKKMKILLWVFSKAKIVVPQNGWFIMENPIKIGWFGGTTIFGNIPSVTLAIIIKCLFGGRIFSTLLQVFHDEAGSIWTNLRRGLNDLKTHGWAKYRCWLVFRTSLGSHDYVILKWRVYWCMYIYIYMYI